MLLREFSCRFLSVLRTHSGKKAGHNWLFSKLEVLRCSLLKLIIMILEEARNHVIPSPHQLSCNIEPSSSKSLNSAT